MFDFKDLLVFSGICLGIVALILLIITLVNLIKTIRKINTILDDNGESFGKTTKELPQLTLSINKTLTSVGETLDGINNRFFDDKTENDPVTSIISIVENAANLGLSFIPKRKFFKKRR